MSTLLSSIETLTRYNLVEPTSNYWSSVEIISWINAGIRDLWRDIVDLKQEHYLTIDNTNVSMAASTATLTGVPADVHKVYLIEPRDVTSTSSSRNLIFKPLDYNHVLCQSARTRDAIDPQNDVVYYSITGAGSPAAAPTIYVAPKVSTAVNLSFVYVPTLVAKVASDTVPIPGEADNALVAWATAFARAKERDDRSPDPAWLQIYATEKQHLMQSLGLRQYQEPTITDALFESYWPQS